MNILESIKDAILREVSHDFDFLKSLKKKKVVISILDGPKLLVKEIAISIPKPKVAQISEGTRERIKLVKKSVKVNTDITYLFTLISDIQTVVTRLNFKNITQEGAIEIHNQIQTLNKLLNKTNLRLEQLPNTEGGNEK